MSNSNNINKLESIFNKVLNESQSRYEHWLVSAVSKETTSGQQEDVDDYEAGQPKLIESDTLRGLETLT